MKYPHIGRKEHALTPEFWEGCYRKKEDFWDHGAPSPGLADFLAQEKYKPGKVLVPGCGRGHDCRELARHGFDVVGMDLAPSGVAEARKLARQDRVAVRYVLGDCLRLPRRLWGKFDWVFEHTCFCAIDPDRRDDYVRAMTSALKPRGLFLGVFYHIQPKSGPPFGTTRKELIERFSPRFELVRERVPRSFPNRKGKELLMLWRKKSGGGRD